ncbi:RluA family pseudouridine synthase [Fuchsiella alkaliacetigena]|uniref:RluA family pseudouridine synthase n=1 Tax=Fuchsiella alkaliacetigena TaxID=957042 RepID=UPI00200A5449|nr:RluA family pseudouridine synthase [Fuchsiella alkaliacetigena]MCK8825328.1 RluA family pseudouridine synthase [Fuchsiella alkaliacetigena]
MSEEYTFIVEKQENQGQRLDKFLAENIEELSRSYIQKLIDEGQVTVDGAAKKSSYTLQLEDSIKVAIPPLEEPDLVAEDIPVDIIYEDQHLVVVNKSADLVVHPAAGHSSGTLVNALLYHCDNLAGIGGEIRPGIVHRLDKDTSGVMVVAKSDLAHRQLVEDFKERRVKKVYLALVEGQVKHQRAKIDAAIGRDPKNRKKMAVTSRNSKKAITRFEVLERFGDYSYLRLELKTGRTHQIRVHMEYLGHPIVGDQTYGYNKVSLGAKRQLLHASQLGLKHPIKEEWMEFEAQLPEDMEGILKELKENT